MSEVVVRFAEPVQLREPDTGEVIVADRHTVSADLFQQGTEWAVVLDDQGRFLLAGQHSLSCVSSGDPAQRREWPDQVKWTTPRANEPWTHAEDDWLIDEFQSGLSVAEIARLHDRRSGAMLKDQVCSPDAARL